MSNNVGLTGAKLVDRICYLPTVSAARLYQLKINKLVNILLHSVVL